MKKVVKKDFSSDGDIVDLNEGKKRKRGGSSSTPILIGDVLDIKDNIVYPKTYKERSALPMKIGCHVSRANKLSNAVKNAVGFRATAFALFLKNHRTWRFKPLTDKEVKEFRDLLEEHNFPSDAIIPHGSYLVNLCSPDEEVRRKSIENVIDDMNRAQMLDIKLLNIHPGSTKGEFTPSEGCKVVAESINEIHEKTNRSAKDVVLVLENTAGGGKVLGGNIEELKSIMDGVNDISRLGFCLDTQHAFASGFDIRTERGISSLFKKFDELIGLEKLKGMHLNDSKTDLGLHKDRHENIGDGLIGLEPFRWIVNNDRLAGIPLVVETPDSEHYDEEVDKLFALLEDEGSLKSKTQSSTKLEEDERDSKRRRV